MDQKLILTLKSPVSRVDRPETGPFHQMAPKESIIPAYIDDVYILTNHIVSWDKEAWKWSYWVIGYLQISKRMIIGCEVYYQAFWDLQHSVNPTKSLRLQVFMKAEECEADTVL